MTLKEFFKKHDGEIDVLEVVDLDGVEMENVPGRAKVIAYNAEAGFFSVMVDPVIPAKI